MILCCKTCGHYLESDVQGIECDYCCGSTDVLFDDGEVKAIDKYELSKMIDFAREKYKVNNPDFNDELWKTREYKECVSEQNSMKYKLKSHMLTTGYSFEGYRIVDYKGVISGQVVLGTGFLSEFSASFSDFFGMEANFFSDKLEKAKNAAKERLIEKSVLSGGNAIIGVDFDYIMFSYNMIGVIANGTSVIIEEM